MPRPPTAGPLTIWGATKNYPAGPNPWNGSATKIDPGATFIQQGYTPGEQPPAEFWNFYENRLASLLSYLDTIDLLNPTQGDQLTPVTLAGGQHAIAWTGSGSNTSAQGDNGLYVVTGNNAGAPVLQTSPDGIQGWKNVAGILPGGSTPFGSIAINPHDGGTWLGKITSGVVLTGDIAGGWTARLLPVLSPACYSIVYDSTYTGASAAFIFGGSAVPAASPQPQAWQSIGGIAPSAITLTNAVTYDGKVTLLAVGKPAGTQTRIAIVPVTAPSAQVRAWSNIADNAFANPWTDNGATGMVNPTGFAYGASDGVFLAVEGTGVGAGKVWQTVDGITWTLVSTLTGAFSGWTFNGLAVQGGVWVSTIVAGSGVSYLGFSLDVGLTWNIVTMASGTSTPGDVITGGGQFFVLQVVSGAFLLPLMTLRTP